MLAGGGAHRRGGGVRTCGSRFRRHDGGREVARERRHRGPRCHRTQLRGEQFRGRLPPLQRDSHPRPGQAWHRRRLQRGDDRHRALVPRGCHRRGEGALPRGAPVRGGGGSRARQPGGGHGRRRGRQSRQRDGSGPSRPLRGGDRCRLSGGVGRECPHPHGPSGFHRHGASGIDPPAGRRAPGHPRRNQLPPRRRGAGDRPRGRQV